MNKAEKGASKFTLSNCPKTVQHTVTSKMQRNTFNNSARWVSKLGVVHPVSARLASTCSGHKHWTRTSPCSSTFPKSWMAICPQTIRLCAQDCSSHGQWIVVLATRLDPVRLLFHHVCSLSRHYYPTLGCYTLVRPLHTHTHMHTNRHACMHSHTLSNSPTWQTLPATKLANLKTSQDGQVMRQTTSSRNPISSLWDIS